MGKKIIPHLDATLFAKSEGIRAHNDGLVTIASNRYNTESRRRTGTIGHYTKGKWGQWIFTPNLAGLRLGAGPVVTYSHGDMMRDIALSMRRNREEGRAERRDD